MPGVELLLLEVPRLSNFGELIIVLKPIGKELFMSLNFLIVWKCSFLIGQIGLELLLLEVPRLTTFGDFIFVLHAT